MDDYITKKVKWFRIETIHGQWPCQDSWKIKTTLKNYSYIFNVSNCLHRIQTFHFAYLLHKAICRSRKYMKQTLRHDCFPIIPVIIPRRSRNYFWKVIFLSLLRLLRPCIYFRWFRYTSLSEVRTSLKKA